MPALNKMLVLSVLLAFLGFTKCQDLPSRYKNCSFEMTGQCKLGHITQSLGSLTLGAFRCLIRCTCTCREQYRATPDQPYRPCVFLTLCSSVHCVPSFGSLQYSMNIFSVSAVTCFLLKLENRSAFIFPVTIFASKSDYLLKNIAVKCLFPLSTFPVLGSWMPFKCCWLLL